MLLVSCYIKKTSRICIIIIFIQKICTEMKNTLRNFVIDTSYARSFNIKYFSFWDQNNNRDKFYSCWCKRKKNKRWKRKGSDYLEQPSHVWRIQQCHHIFKRKIFPFHIVLLEIIDHLTAVAKIKSIKASYKMCRWRTRKITFFNKKEKVGGNICQNGHNSQRNVFSFLRYRMTVVIKRENVKVSFSILAYTWIFQAYDKIVNWLFNRLRNFTAIALHS